MDVLDDFNSRLSDFQDTVNTSQLTLANFEEQLALHDTPGKMDPKSLEHLKVKQFIYNFIHEFMCNKDVTFQEIS